MNPNPSADLMIAVVGTLTASPMEFLVADMGTPDRLQRKGQPHYILPTVYPTVSLALLVSDCQKTYIAKPRMSIVQRSLFEVT